MPQKKDKENQGMQEAPEFESYKDLVEESEALKMIDSKPFWGTRGLVYLLTFLVGSALLWSYVAKFRETVKAPGLLIVAGKPIMVQAQQSGYVTRILVKNGDSVKEDDILLVFSKVRDRPKEDVLAEIAKLKDIKEAKERNLNIKKEQLIAANEGLVRNKEQHSIYKSMFDKGLLAKVDFLGAYRALDEAERLVGDLSSQIELDEVEIANDQRDLDRFEAMLIPYDLEEDGKSAGELRIGADEDVLRAPVSGWISNVALNHAGIVVKEGEVVMQLLPKGVPLVASINIPNDGMADVEVGLPVNLKLAAFPYKKYGFVEGRLSKIAPDAIISKEGGAMFYEAEVELNQNYLKYKGETYTFRSGLELEADIITKRKRVITMFMDFVRGIMP